MVDVPLQTGKALHPTSIFEMQFQYIIGQTIMVPTQSMPQSNISLKGISSQLSTSRILLQVGVGTTPYLPIFITILTVRNISFDCTFSKSFKIMNISDPNWNKLRLNWVNFIKEPSIAWLFAKNQYYAMQDVGLHIKGTELRDKSEQTARATCKTAFLSHEIFEHLNEGYERPLFLQ